MQQTNTDNWTEIISPKTNPFDLRLADVWRYKDLLLQLVKRDFYAQYRQTILGPLWHLIQPALTTFMFFVVFNKIANIPTGGLPASLFYMCSITIWNYFSSCFSSTSATFTTNASLFGKVYFPRLVMPLSSVVSNIIRFGIQLLLLIAFIIYHQAAGTYHFHFGFNNLLIPVIIIIMAGMGLGAGIIISSLTTKYRDFTVLIAFGVQLLMYITPVAYPLSYAQKSSYKNLIEFNPLTAPVEGFRYAVFGEGDFNLSLFIYSIVCMLVLLFAGVLMFNKVEKSFMDTV